MDTILKADIFFFIASVGFIVVTLVTLVLGYYALQILRHIRKLLGAVQDEVDHLRAKRHAIEVHVRTFEKLASVVRRNFFGVPSEERSRERSTNYHS